MDFDFKAKFNEMAKKSMPDFSQVIPTTPKLDMLSYTNADRTSVEIRNILSENQTALEEQVSALKSIAESSNAQAKSAANIAEASKIQAESAVDIANSSKVQAGLAVKEADKANDTSLSAKLRANKALIVSIIAILVTLIVNADRIVHNVLVILSRLGTI